MCQRTLNSSRSYVCKSLTNVANRDAVKCYQDYCRIPNTRLCIPVFVSDGKICDRMKRCTGGQCVHDTTPGSENVDPDCVWGDQRILESAELAFYGTCQSFIDKYGRMHCYTSPINETCCSTCKLLKSGAPGCEYGDRSKECVEHLRGQVCPRYKNTLCCDYCKDYVTKRSTPDDSLVVLNVTELDDSMLIDNVLPYQVKTIKSLATE
ncbi:hypothetical protein Btru_058030 [Bulinus truncatus]|nr:hypothetical protein Btru_058030 [Bulinus truncatus]